MSRDSFKMVPRFIRFDLKKKTHTELIKPIKLHQFKNFENCLIKTWCGLRYLKLSWKVNREVYSGRNMTVVNSLVGTVRENKRFLPINIKFNKKISNYSESFAYSRDGTAYSYVRMNNQKTSSLPLHL